MFCFSCDHNPAGQVDDSEFAIYLLADSTITAVDAVKQSIAALVLSEEPIISTKDFVSYKWSSHQFSLKSDAENRLKNIANLRQTVFGIPFVITVSDERIYVGTFWYAFSSIAPAFPFIDVTSLLLQGKPDIPFTIEKSWFEEQSDKRSDQRIYIALLKAGVLIP